MIVYVYDGYVTSVECQFSLHLNTSYTVVPAKSDSDVMFCLQRYQGLRIDRSLVY